MPRRKNWPSDFSDCAPIISSSKHARRNAVQEEISSSDQVEDSLVSCRSFGVFVTAFCKFELEERIPVHLLISISLNKNSNYCYIPRSTKNTDTRKWSGRVF